jgi:putative PIN family toxin of toxin-antitoxin system
MKRYRRRVVFDCNVFVQALVGRPGPAAQCLRLAETDQIQLFTSRQVLAEIEDVLSRPAISHFIQGPPEAHIQRFVAGILSVSTRASRYVTVPLRT